MALFENLDKPYSNKRVILLVAVGKEGWDCKSLTAVVLPRQKTTKNFVLQTSARCLREIKDAKQEHALIYLEKDNYNTLNDELKKNYNLEISDLKINDDNFIDVQIRKPKLGKLKYTQIIKKWSIITNQKKVDIKKCLDSFSLNDIKKKYKYKISVTKSKIGKKGLVSEVDINYDSDESEELFFEDFLYKLSFSTFYKFSESDLLKKYEKELKKILKLIKKEKKWIYNNPQIEMSDIIREIACLLMKEIEYKIDIIKKDIEMELLEWNNLKPKMSLLQSNGNICRFVPTITKKDSIGARGYQKHPEYLEEDYFSDENNIDPQDISYNYIPYKTDSNFEINALKEIVKISEMKELEVYFNGYKNENFNSFYIQTPRGVYTPDFLIIKRKEIGNIKSDIEKILIVETKGSVFYDDDFKQKENFVKNDFIKNNPKFTYKCFVDSGGNDFSKHIEKFKDEIKKL